MFTLHESGTLKNCGNIIKALTRESFLKQEIQKRNGAYFFFTNIFKNLPLYKVFKCRKFIM